MYIYIYLDLEPKAFYFIAVEPTFCLILATNDFATASTRMVYQIDLYCILTDIYLLNYEEDPKEQVNIPCFDYCD